MVGSVWATGCGQLPVSFLTYPLGSPSAAPRQATAARRWGNRLGADTRGCLPFPALGSSRGGGGAAVVVLAANDVVLAQVRAVLDLDEDHRDPAGVLDPVPGPARDVDRAPRPEPLRAARDDDAR